MTAFDNLDRPTSAPSAKARPSQPTTTRQGPHWTAYAFFVIAIYWTLHLAVFDYAFLRTTFKIAEEIQRHR